jgi:hypothetical protein
MNIEFSGPIWYWRGPAPWYFVTIPPEQSDAIKAISRMVTYGWGCILVRVSIGRTAYTTWIFPKDDRYIVPVKASVRKAEGLSEGDVVEMRLSVG